MKRSSASSHEQSVLMFRNNLIEDGWKFDPTNEKLISKHLKPKILGEYKGDKEVIGEIDLCKFEPCDLPGLSKLKSDDQVWFFLCPRHFCGTSRRSKRRTKAGYWKPTGQVRWIKDTRTKREIGTKKTLVFYKKASPKDLRTRWTIYEYEYLPEPNLNIQREFVLIRLEKKAPNVKNQATSDVQKHATQSVQNQTTCEVLKHTTQSVQNQTTFDAQNQATTNVPNQDNQVNYSQNAYFGEPSYHTSFKLQAHNSGTPMVNNSAVNQSEVSHYMVNNSPDNQSEISHYMAYLDNTKQFPNELIPNSDGYYSMPDNQNPSKSVALSTIESCLLASDFENRNSTYELKDRWVPYMGTPPDPSLLASISSCQSLRFKDYLNCPMASISSISPYQSPYYNSYSSDPIGSTTQYQDISASMECEWSVPMALPSEIGTENPLTKSYKSIHEQNNRHFSTQNPDTNSNMLILEQGNQHSSMAYFPESDVLEGVAMFPELSPKPLAEFTGDDMDLLSLSEIQTPYDNNKVCCLRDSDLVYQPPYSHGEPCSLWATDNENQNKDKNVNVSASQEREKNSLVAASLDYESQNASMSDLLVAGGNYWSPLMTSLSENDAQGGIVLTEEQSQLLRTD